ncbi:MAG: hypothetical protein ACT4OL_07370 [Nitrospiraceae bacterium]
MRVPPESMRQLLRILGLTVLLLSGPSGLMPYNAASVAQAQLGKLDAASKGTQHPTSLRIDGDGDAVLVEGR